MLVVMLKFALRNFTVEVGLSSPHLTLQEPEPLNLTLNRKKEHDFYVIQMY